MDRLIFTAMSALKQLDSMKLKNSNALANASTVGFKETYTFATQTAQVAGAGFDSRFVPMNRSNDELVIRSVHRNKARIEPCAGNLCGLSCEGKRLLESNCRGICQRIRVF